MAATRSNADPGLFGPDSVTWQAHGDPMMWIAGIRALYLQACTPAPYGVSRRTATSGATPGAA